MNNIPNPFNQVITRGVKATFEPQNALSDLWVATLEAFKKEPVESNDGGNDKTFFSFVFKGTKLFAAKNELNGLTVMLPEEY